jgi:hypothetical protein
VRLKVLLLFSVFVVSALAMDSGFVRSDLPLAIAAIAAVGVYFVRCETCRSTIYYERGGSRHVPVGPYASRFMFQKRCPVCSQGRL